VAVLVLSAGCSTSSPAATPPHTSTAGPTRSGVTTLDLGSPAPVFGERIATVYYPADPGTWPVTRSSATTRPRPSRSRSRHPAARYNTTTSVDGTRRPASKKGHVPIVLFSTLRRRAPLILEPAHGIARGDVVVSRRLISSAGWAGRSWGPKRNRLRHSTRRYAVVARRHRTGFLADDSVLFGVADPHRVAPSAIGRGWTAFDALDTPAVATAIGWAPVAPGGDNRRGSRYVESAPRAIQVVRCLGQAHLRLVPRPEIAGRDLRRGTQHYTDICSGQGGGRPHRYAISHPSSRRRWPKLGINGCQKSDSHPSASGDRPVLHSLRLKDQFDGEGQATIPLPLPISSRASRSPSHIG